MNTIIILWDQQQSSYDDEIIQMNIKGIERVNGSHKNVYEELFYDDYLLFVSSSQRVMTGDRFFLVCNGNKQQGICASGYLASDYYEEKEIVEGGRLINELDLIPEYLINPNYHPILSINKIVEKIQDFKWQDNAYGYILSESHSLLLEQLWNDYLNENTGVFLHWAAKQSFNFSSLVPDKEEVVYIGITDEGKISAHNYQCDLTIECDDIESATLEAKDYIYNKYGGSKTIKFQYVYDFCDDNDLIKSVLEIISDSCKGLKDKSGQPIIKKIVASSKIDALHGTRIIAMLLKLIEEGLTTEEILQDKGLPKELLTSINILIKKEEETFESYIDRVALDFQARNYMIDVLDDRLKIIYRYKELKESDFLDLNKWLKAYHKLSDYRRSEIINEINYDDFS